MSTKTKLLLGMGLLLVCGWLSGGSASAATYTVTSTSDAGAGSLRQAILDANADSSAPHTIDFAIPGSGQHTISLQSNLPAITKQTLIDGKTQPGSPLFCDTANSVEPPRIILQNASGGGLWLYPTYGGENSEIRGLVFGPDVAVRASEGANINCNYFGTSDGLSVNGASQYDQSYFITADSPNSHITDNVFANIDGVASFFGAVNSAAGSTTIQHNFFNLSAVGASITGSHYNFSALFASGGTVLLGGTNVNEANFISGYSYGVDSSDNVTALGNRITDTGAPLRTYDSVSSPRSAPIIRSSAEAGGSTTLSIELDDTYPAGTYRLEVFRNPTRRGTGFVPLDNPSTDNALHGIEATELAGYVVVEKTTNDSQTLSAVIAATGVTFPTVTATVQNPDTSYGGTSRLGYLSTGEALAATFDTNLGSQKCFQGGTTGDWTITVTNNGTQPAYEFGLLFRYGPNTGTPSSQIDYDHITTTGTATHTDYVGVYQIPSGTPPGSIMFWEGDLQPGQHVELHMPIAYNSSDIYMIALNINSDVPADVFDGSKMATALYQSAALGNFQAGSAMNCQYAVDLSVQTRVGDAGITPGGSGEYIVEFHNNGPTALPDRPAFSSPISPTSITGITYIALDRGVSAVSMSMPEVKVCTFFDPGEVGSNGPTGDVNGCQIMCIDTGLISGAGLAELTEANGYGMLIMCYQSVGIPVGGQRTMTIKVAADDSVSSGTRFGAFSSDFPSVYGSFTGSMLTPEYAPFDNDTLSMMVHFYARASFSGESVNPNVYEILAYPINNSSRLLGITGGATGGIPDGTDKVAGVLASSGVSVQIMIGLSVSLVGAVWLIQQHRRCRYVLQA